MDRRPLARQVVERLALRMKHLLAALLLVLQLRPLLGTAVCLSFSDGAAGAECEMPDSVAVPHSAVAHTESPAPNCALASVCAPSPLAILGPVESLQTVVAFYSPSPVMAAPALFGISSAPPFHPPRA